MAGKIVWTDLTVTNAEEVKSFYQSVIGWNSEPASMGDYDDYNMQSGDDNSTVAGICHAKGVNADLPPVWMVYISVDDLQASLQNCKKLGGTVLRAPSGKNQNAVIKDPAGAICSLYQE